MNPNFSMLRDLVMVYPITSKQQTDTNIIVTSLIDKTAPKEGVVLAAGPGILDEDSLEVKPIDYSFGDRVIYSMSNLQEIKYGKEVFHVVPAGEILCKLKEE